VLAVPGVRHRPSSGDAVCSDAQESAGAMVIRGVLELFGNLVLEPDAL
jgi:hypothetical protein